MNRAHCSCTTLYIHSQDGDANVVSVCVCSLGAFFWKLQSETKEEENNPAATMAMHLLSEQIHTKYIFVLTVQFCSTLPSSECSVNYWKCNRISSNTTWHILDVLPGTTGKTTQRSLLHSSRSEGFSFWQFGPILHFYFSNLSLCLSCLICHYTCSTIKPVSLSPTLSKCHSIRCSV